MIKKLAPVLAAAAAATMLFAGSASAATSHTFASCHAKGRAAHCVAEGTVKRPSSLWLHVRAQPHQKVVVGWAVQCKKGTGKRHKSGGFVGTAAPTLTRKIPMLYKHPASCIAAAVGGLTKRGSVRVWLTVGK